MVYLPSGTLLSKWPIELLSSLSGRTNLPASVVARSGASSSAGRVAGAPPVRVASWALGRFFSWVLRTALVYSPLCCSITCWNEVAWSAISWAWSVPFITRRAL